MDVDRSEERSGVPSGAYERLRSARDDGDLAKQETRALRDKVRQLDAENAFLRQQLEALDDPAQDSPRPADVEKRRRSLASSRLPAHPS